MTKQQKIDDGGIFAPLSDDQINALKRKESTGVIFEIQVQYDSGEILEDQEFFYFKKVDMTVLSAASRFMQDDPLKVGMIVFENTLVSGRKSAANDVDVFPAVVSRLTETMKEANSTLKKR